LGTATQLGIRSATLWAKRNFGGRGLGRGGHTVKKGEKEVSVDGKK